jgi:hypothetical protein
VFFLEVCVGVPGEGGDADDQATQRDRIKVLFWPLLPPRSAQSVLHSCDKPGIARLEAFRRSVGADADRAAPSGYRRLGQVRDRWIYSACLCFGLDLDEQARSGFRYGYSVYQAE